MLLGPARLVLALAVASALGTCCAGPTDPPDARVDGPSDAPAERDARDGPDVPRDGPLDSGTTGGWLRVAGTWPDWCRVEQADDDLVGSTSFSITPCTDRSGCRELLRDWPIGTGANPQPLRIDGGHGNHDGSRGLVIVLRDTGERDHELWVLDDLGQAVLGLRTDRASTSGRSAYYADVSDSRFATEVGYAEGDRFAADHLIEADLADPHALRFAGDIAATTPGIDSIQDLYVSDTATAVHVNSFVLVRVTASRGIEAAYSDAFSLGVLRGLVDETLLFTTFDGTTTDVRAAPPGAPVETLAAPGRNAYRIASDGAHVAWLEWDSSGPSGRENLDVMVSPYAEDAASLTPRLLEHFAFGDERALGVGHGYVAFPPSIDHLHIYRIADGAIADVAAPTGEWWWGPPAYLGPEEFAIGAGPDNRLRAQLRLMFIRYDSLSWSVP